jgi:large subunit ribosomal protein L54
MEMGVDRTWKSAKKMSFLTRTSPRLVFGNLLRGPKKPAAPAGAKKAKGKGGPSDADNAGDAEGGHIFNIFAGVPDSQLQPDEMYPDWLWKLAEPPKTYAELSSMFIYGAGIENATENDYRRFLRQHRKLVVKVNNSRLKKSKSPSENKIRFP